MNHRLLPAIDAVAAQDWNALDGAQAPFLTHEFLAALERTQCVTRTGGWQPAHLALHDARGLAAAMPLYRKSHSWGEFVFDFSWAQAYARHGLDYYPKLLAAEPFTPATGPRFHVRPDLDRATTVTQVLQALRDELTRASISSAHVLFVDERDRAALQQAGWLMRRDCQFHWYNQGYTDFEQYLASFTADKRKKAKRERRRCAEAGIEFRTLYGPELDAKLLDEVHALHASTFARHGHEPYLNRAFFAEIAQTLGERFMVKLAVHAGTPVAAAVFFWSPQTLYGRYWGAHGDYHSLHFEACYYQGIEFCIEKGIARFEPGTQGEHKVARGFEPTLTWSAHWLTDARFRAAIGDYLEREGPAVDAYAAEVEAHTPFRRDDITLP